MVSRKNLEKPINIKTFKNMNRKPKTPKTGIVYFVEPIKSLTNDPTIKGDIFKKFVNGKLIKQVFVSKNRMKKIVKTAKEKAQIKTGGKTRKMRRHMMEKNNMMRPNLPPPRPVYVNDQPVYMNQQQPQGQLPAQQIYAADNTTMGQAAKQGLAGGIGFFAAEKIVEGVFGAFGDN
jgi:hypothetical protein